MNSTVPGISNALSQMRTMAAEADGRGSTQGLSGGAGGGFGRMGGIGGIGGARGIGEAGGAQGPDALGGADGSSFADMLKASLAKVSQTQNHSIAEAHAFETGSSDTSLSDVMIDMQKANIQFQTAVQVRNKLVSAYNDIMQMQV